jgi:hypothetical protein
MNMSIVICCMALLAGAAGAAVNSSVAITVNANDKRVIGT